MVTPIPRGTRFSDPAGRSMFRAHGRPNRNFFHDVPEALADWAVARLRPQAATPLLEPWPLGSWPAVPRLVVLRDDRAVRLEATIDAARTITASPPVILDGSHSPFLSRPTQLADVLASWSAAPVRP